MTVTIVHPVILNRDKQYGGIETWISDFLQHSKLDYKVLGVKVKDGPNKSFQTRAGVEAKVIASFPPRRRAFPNLLRLVFGLVANSNQLTDHVWVHRIELVPILRILKPRAKITLTVHTDLEAQRMPGSDSLWRLLPRLFPIWESLSLKSCSNILVYSSKQAAGYKSRGIECQLGEAWYDDSTFLLDNSSSRDLSVLWVGRFEEVKDPLLALATFEKILETLNLRIVMIGAGSLRTNVERALIEKGLNHRVKVLDPLDSRNLARMFLSSKVLLQTSRFEGGPRILLEALACGTNVVSTLEGDPEMWSSNTEFGVLVNSRDPEILAKAVSKALMAEDLQSHQLQKIRSRGASTIVPQIERWLIANSNPL